MKPINKQELKDTLILGLLTIFFASGWILFILSEISKDKTITDEINRQTVSLKQQIVPLRDTIIRHEDDSYMIKHINELINENHNLSDSLDYYSTFYNMIRETYTFQYSVEKESQKNGIVYKYSLSELKPVSAQKNTTTQIKKNDSISDIRN